MILSTLFPDTESRGFCKPAHRPAEPDSPSPKGSAGGYSTLDGCTHCRLRRLVGVKVLQIHACGLSGGQAACWAGGVPPGALAAHPGRHPVLTQELPGAVGALLTPTLGRHEEARRGLPLQLAIETAWVTSSARLWGASHPPTAREHSARPRARESPPSPVGREGRARRRRDPARVVGAPARRTQRCPVSCPCCVGAACARRGRLSPS